MINNLKSKILSTIALITKRKIFITTEGTREKIIENKFKNKLNTTE